MDNILAAQGFEIEYTGGGCYALDKDFSSGAWIWVTCEQGCDVPTHDDWRVCAYPANYWESDGGGILLADVHTGQAATVFDAVAFAIETIAQLEQERLTARLLEFCRQENIKPACASELLANAQAQVEFLTAFVRQWEEATGHE